MSFNRSDCRIDIFRAGPGGFGVRVTHIFTGIVLYKTGEDQDDIAEVTDDLVTQMEQAVMIREARE